MMILVLKVDGHSCCAVDGTWYIWNDLKSYPYPVTAVQRNIKANEGCSAVPLPASGMGIRRSGR
eukprot:scaffold14776_cov97-Cyclotella_meneghiniana.AAC.5